MSYVKKIRKKIGHDDLILVGANIILTNTENQILLQKRNEGTWGLLGGLMEIGESLEETAIREVKEESGLEIANLKLLNVFSGSQYYFVLPNKDRIYVVTSLYMAEIIGGKLQPDGIESLDLQYFDLDHLPFNLEKEYKTYIDYYKNMLNTLK